jgi:hypothetical protein
MGRQDLLSFSMSNASLLSSFCLGAVGFSSQLGAFPLIRLANKKGFNIPKFLQSYHLMKTKKLNYHKSVSFNDLILKRIHLQEFQNASASYWKSMIFTLGPFVSALGFGYLGWKFWKYQSLFPIQSLSSPSIDYGLVFGLGTTFTMFSRKFGLSLWRGPAFVPFAIGLGLMGMGSSMFLRENTKIYLLGTSLGFSVLQIC